jgi:hypothetical protein
VAHFEIHVGGCKAVDEPKDKKDVDLFFAGAIEHSGRFLLCAKARRSRKDEFVTFGFPRCSRNSEQLTPR